MWSLILMKKFTRFKRQIGKASADFEMIQNGDKFLIPIDTDYPHLSLAAFFQQKNIVLPDSKPLCIIHFHSSEEPSSETVDYLDKFCAKRKITYSCKKVENVTSRTLYKKVLIDTALEFECNKIALPDSLDYLDASILSNMAFNAVFTGPSVIEKVETDGQTVTFIRPFCYLTDEEIEKLGEVNEFPNAPTGIRISENEEMAIARRAMNHFLDGTSNIRMNFFNAQSNIQKKYIGNGDNEEPIHFTEDVEI
ncbi:hypothetical protein TRFO_28729 [Tritrichomonas foetus]|uniref:Uncharacterized protein n=1 Tax=Tritrichomonas foetus TaxID=1144522 RepID=A0A1J4K2I0_9EUKA|nr:hypothetical protein TRFO_28729 [Tritrichomonas foetus]|eukprot:OHT03942.1 hypothetical protein TRFO_28729 [Tritrichomonas foetus]